MTSCNLPHALLEYSISLLDRADEVTDRYDEMGFCTYSDIVGPHLRHVIEHYEALLLALRTNTGKTHSLLVDYDARARDQLVERDPHVAQTRLRFLQAGLQGLRRDGSHALDRAVTVRSLVGHAGQIELITQSTIARELTFLASHAVHHFALLEGLARARGASFGVNFGRAPATVANDQLQQNEKQLHEAHE